MPTNTREAAITNLLRHLQERLEERVYADLPEDEKGMVNCRINYESLLKGSLRIKKAEEVTGLLRGKGVITCGDYHPLSESKAALLSIVERMEERPLLALGCLRSWRGGPRQITNPLKLLEERARDWPFPKEQWLPLLRHAAKEELPVIGLRGRGESNLSEEQRYEMWTKRLERAQKVHNGPVFAILGEINGAWQNLPMRLKEANIGHVVPALLLAPAILYWRLMSEGVDPCSVLAQLDGDILAIAPCHPLRRVNAYLAWQEGEPEFEVPPAEVWAPSSMKENPLPHLSQKISSFFGADNLFSSPRIFQPRHVEGLADLILGLSIDEGEALLAHMAENQSYCAPTGQYIYLAQLTLSHLGEELTHALHLRLSPPPERELSFTDDYYHHVMREAIGFFGSKVLCPGRVYPTMETLAWQAEDVFSPLGLGAQIALELIEEEEVGNIQGPQEVYSQEILNAVVHAMGYRLGQRLWQEKGSSDIARVLIRKGLSEPDAAKTLYVDLVSQ